VKLLGLILVSLFAAAGLTLFALANPGYVLIARDPWSVEMSLTLFVVLLLVLFVVVQVSWRLLVRIWNTPSAVARWRERRQVARSRDALQAGLLALAEGQWPQAEKALLSHLRHSESPFLNYLGAAIAAQQDGQLDKRDEFLALAHTHAPEDSLALPLLQAQLQILAHQRERALATLNHVRTGAARHPQALRLLLDLHRELHDWQSVIALLPEARAARALPPEALDRIEHDARLALLSLELPTGSAKVLQRAWDDLPARLRREPSLLAAYARQLAEQGDHAQAERLVAAALDVQWDDELALCYGELQGADDTSMLERAENWLITHGDRAALLVTLGRLARRAGRLDQARRYLDKALAHGAAPAVAAAELAELLIDQGDRDGAIRAFREAMRRP
jgi:HemY protein